MNPYRKGSQLAATWDEGRRAAVRGKPMGDCPYDARRPLREVAWKKGWQVGDAEVKG